MAKYHLKKDGTPGVCKARPGFCPRGVAEDHYATPAEARQAFEASMAGEAFTGTRPAASAKAARPPIAAITHEDGTPRTIFHGSAEDFQTFDPARTGYGNDSYGSGFYFSTSAATAAGYGAVKEYQVTMHNPLIIDGHEHMSMNDVMLEASELEQLILRHPSLYRQPTDDEMSVLADYSPAYWAKDKHSEEEMRALARSVAREYFSEGTSFTHVESFYGREHAAALRAALHEVKGWDGVIVNFAREDASHVIAWFPEQINVVEK